MLAIYKKELRSYFTSIMGYVFLAIFLTIIGIEFVNINMVGQIASFELTIQRVLWLTIMIFPLITMRLMSEENKQKTDQLLYTSPVTAGNIVLGKFLSVCTLFGVAVLIMCFYPFILTLYGDISFITTYSSILGFFLMGAAYLAIGLFISSLTESQVVAAVITYIIFIVTVLIDEIVLLLPADHKSASITFSILILVIAVILYIMMHNLTVTIGFGTIGIALVAAIYFMKPTLYDGAVAKVFGWVSVVDRYGDFIMGIFDLSNIIYYISIIFIFLFLTTQSIKKKRWS